MVDDIDRLQELDDIETSAFIQQVRRQVIPAGVPGVCRECDEESKRLVAGRCAPCRDER